MHTVDTHHSTRGARRCAAPSKRGLVAWCYSTQCSPSLDRWSSGSSTPARSARSAANGLESFTTVVLDSLHYESHLMCTNCGPLGLKADVGAVDQPRGALGPLVGAHRALERRPRGGRRRLRRARSAPTTSSSRSTGTACCSCLVAYVLIFIKHIPRASPTSATRNMLCNKWYEILWTEYNLPRPSKRKKIKLRMMLDLFAAESAVFEKFWAARVGRRLPGHAPDAERPPVALCIEQLVDVVCSLQRCLDHEAILNAWSHSLDHSPATSAHVFQMKTVLAQLHGSELDRRVLVGDPAPQAAPAAPRHRRLRAGGAEAARTTRRLDASGGRSSLTTCQLALPTPAPRRRTRRPRRPPPPPPPPSAPALGRWRPPVAAARRHARRLGPAQQHALAEPPSNERGHAHAHRVPACGPDHGRDSMTRQRAADTADELATHARAAVRAEQPRAHQEDCARGLSEHWQVTKLLTDCVGQRDNGSPSTAWRPPVARSISARQRGGRVHAERDGPAQPRHGHGLPG